MNNNLIEVKNICDALLATNSRLEKEKIISDNKNNELFLEVLDFVYNPFVLTGISDKKMNKNIIQSSSINLDYSELLYALPTSGSNTDIRKVFEYLKENHTGRDQDIIVIQLYMREVCEKNDGDKDFVKSIITKSLKIGIDASTINKALGKDLIPTFEVQLAQSYWDNVEDVEGEEFTLTTKIDGNRIVAICRGDDNDVKCYTRQGQLYLGLTEIENELKKMKITNFVLDGELSLLDSAGLASGEQYSAVSKILRTDGEKTGIKIVAFDSISTKDFDNRTCTTQYNVRRKVLENQFENMKFVSVLPALYIGSDTAMIYKILDEQTEKGEEGIMLNLNNAFYQFKRTASLLKVKKFKEADVLVTGVAEGLKKSTKGTLGAITVEFIHEGKHYQSECGSGFSKEERLEYWKNPNLLIGKIVTIKYFEVTKNKQGTHGLRFAVWTKRIRDDKTEISMH